MTHLDFIKVELATPMITIGNPILNVDPIVNILNKSKAGIVLFPELSISGYTAADLFFQDFFIKESLEALNQIVNKTTFKGVYIIGMPLLINQLLYNVAVVIQDKIIKGVIPKYNIPNFKEHNEKRWFNPGEIHDLVYIEVLNQKVPFGEMIFTDKKLDIFFGVEVCQDMWVVNPPSNKLALSGAQMIFNLSASPETVFKPKIRKNIVLEASRRQVGAYLYTSSGPNESTSDVTYSTHKLAALLGTAIYESNPLSNEESSIVDIDIESIRYERRNQTAFNDERTKTNPIKMVNVEFTNDKNFKLARPLNKTPFLPNKEDINSLKLANELQVRGLVKKLQSVPTKKLVIGISGGLDSTLALLVAHQSYLRLSRDTKDIIGVTLPSDVTSSESKNDALKLMKLLNITSMEVSIKEQVKTHLDSLNHESKDDITYENVQARLRTLNLMSISNKENAIVLGTGDMSEIALGWMTFNGDQMSMYNVNSGLPKIWIKLLINYHSKSEYNKLDSVLKNILNRPISPELKPNQSTEEVIGKYEINDFILYHFLVNGSSEAKCAWLVNQTFELSKEESDIYASRFFTRFYNQQFKRMPMPEGPKVLKVSLSPRTDLRLPADIKRK